MMRTRRASPIPRFLDVSAEAGPLELLGLSPAECTPSRVEAALQRQLDRVSSHAEGDTPEADEVRLALHAGAAQLLDPEVRRTIIEEHATRTFGMAPHAEAPSTVPEESPRRTDESANGQPEHAGSPVIRALPASGYESVGTSRYATSPDPNATVKKVLLIGGIAAFLVIGGVVGLILLTPGSPRAPSGGSTSGGGATATTSAAPPAPVAAPPTVSAPSEVATSGAMPGESEKPAGATKPAATKSQFVDAAQIIRDLRLAAAKAKTDPAAAMADYRKAVAVLAAWWPRYDVGERRAADDGVLEFLYVVSDKPESAAAIAELAKRAVLPPIEAGQLSPEAVWPAAWATGALTRLSVERGLPRSLGAGVSQALNDALGAGRSAGTLSFEGGAEAALRRMPVRLVAPRSPAQVDADPQAPRAGAEGMKRWADAIAAVGGEAGENERLLVDGLEQILLNGTEPDADQATYEAVEVLVTRIKWRADGTARDRLLEWFNDPRISSADLRVLTGVLAGKSAAENVDASMQLSVTATPDDRAKLRAQYAQAWGMAKTEQRDKAFEQWRGVARGGYFAAPGNDELSDVARVVVAVRINQAARRLWLGDATSCTRILSDIERIPGTIRDIGFGAGQPPLILPGGLPGPTSPPPPSIQPGGRSPRGGKIANQNAPPIAPPGDGPWGEQYLRAERNIPVRMQRLTEAEALQMPLTKLDAAVLAEAACFGSPGQVRLMAQRVVMKFGDDPSIVLAMLDELPTAPKVQSVSDTMVRVARAALPKIGDPEWELATRRALVDRLLGLLAGQGPQAGIDQACAMIGESYIAMAGVDSGPPEESAAERCLRGAGQFYKLWRMEAERLPPPEQAPASLDQIDRRRRSRQQIASGPPQAFAGEQVSIAEVLAYIVCAERPAQASRALAIMNDMARERREAGHIFPQMTATEHAITRLWLLRFGEVAQ
jgi:hypothetical protein